MNCEFLKSWKNVCKHSPNCVFIWVRLVAILSALVSLFPLEKRRRNIFLHHSHFTHKSCSPWEALCKQTRTHFHIWIINVDEKVTLKSLDMSCYVIVIISRYAEVEKLSFNFIRKHFRITERLASSNLMRWGFEKRDLRFKFAYLRK